MAHQSKRDWEKDLYHSNRFEWNKQQIAKGLAPNKSGRTLHQELGKSMSPEAVEKHLEKYHREPKKEQPQRERELRADIKQTKADIKANEQKQKRKVHQRGKIMEADTSGSTCFDSLYWEDGVVTGNFINPTRGEWSWELKRSDAKRWFEESSLGGAFNSWVRE